MFTVNPHIRVLTHYKHDLVYRNYVTAICGHHELPVGNHLLGEPLFAFKLASFSNFSLIDRRDVF